jgi:hypothetical protein
LPPYSSIDCAQLSKFPPEEEDEEEEEEEEEDGLQSPKRFVFQMEEED